MPAPRSVWRWLSLARIEGKPIVPGIGEGTLVIYKGELSPLGEIDPSEGRLSDGRRIRGKILVFKCARGSTVGSFIFYRMRKLGTAPSGIVVERADPITVVGAAISEIPLVEIPGILGCELLKEGLEARVNGEEGYLELLG